MFTAPDIRNIPPIQFLPGKDKSSLKQEQPGGWLAYLFGLLRGGMVYLGLPVHALLRYGFGSRYFTLRHITIALVWLGLLILGRNLYLTSVATWQGWGIQGNLVNYLIGVGLLLSLIQGLRFLVIAGVIWLGYTVLIAGKNPLHGLLAAADGVFSMPVLLAVAVLVGLMLLHRSLAHYWDSTLPVENRIHTHYYGRSLFWRLYPSDTVNTLLMEPTLLAVLYLLIRPAFPELAFYLLVMGVAAFLLSLYAWHAGHRYRQNAGDGENYATRKLQETEPAPDDAPTAQAPVAGIIRRKP